MNILDIIIIIFILFGAVLGFKRGFTKEVVEALGFVVVVIIAYFLKNPLSVIMYEYLPFFKIGLLKNVEILNILVYEGIAFIICVILLSIVLKVLLTITSVFEKIINATIILSLPSKIAGAIVGILYHYVFVFIALYVVSLTIYDVDFIDDSKYKDKILDKTPILSSFADKSVNVINEFIVLKDNYSDKTISESEFNYQAIELFLKYEIITPESLKKLIDEGKIDTFDNYGDLIRTYGGDLNGN